MLGPGGAVRQDWTVRVRAPQPPRIADAFPASPSVDALVGGAIRLGVTARAATPHERLRLTWTVDGTVAGKQETITVQAKAPGMMVVRAVVASNLGAAASREWRINVLPPSVPAPAAPTAAPPAEAKPAAPAAAPLASVVPTPPPPDEQGVRSFLDRYAAAWRAHDVDTLRQLGQVTTDEQARTLRDYFAKVGDLEVEIHLLEVRVDGERTIVRFTRRDRFRDPLGRTIAKESPPIERALVTTPAGACDARRDGWQVMTRTTSYRNRSTALDPPTCTRGSSCGLYCLRYRPSSALDLDFTARTKGSTFPAVVGPVRGTLVLGSTAAAGRAGACGLTASLACTGSGSTLRCR